jgi:hypothetical protein
MLVNCVSEHFCEGNDTEKFMTLSVNIARETDNLSCLATIVNEDDQQICEFLMPVSSIGRLSDRPALNNQTFCLWNRLGSSTTSDQCGGFFRL